MTRNENLLVTAMEECAEIQQAISKCLRFGLDNCYPRSTDKTNVERVMEEYYQLIAVVGMLQGRGVLPIYDPDEINKIIENKTNKVKKYQGFARILGTITDASMG